MKIAISSVGEDVKSQVSEVSGRAPFYLFFENGKLKKVMKNPFLIIGSGGAGFAVASILADEKVDVVISGKFGQNMIDVLKEKGIKYKEMHNITVKEALKNWDKK